MQVFPEARAYSLRAQLGSIDWNDSVESTPTLRKACNKERAPDGWGSRILGGSTNHKGLLLQAIMKSHEKGEDA